MSESGGRLFVSSLASLERQRGGLLGGRGLEGGLSSSFSNSSSVVSRPYLPGVLFPSFHQGSSSGTGDPGSNREGCGRACTSRSGLFQPHVCGHQGYGGLETNYRSVSVKSFGSQDKVPHGDHTIGSQDCSQGRLDGLDRPKRCLSASPHASSKQEVFEVHGGGQTLPVQGSLFWPNYFPSGLHKSYGSSSSLSSSFGNSNPSLPGRLADSGVLPSGGDLGEGSGSSSLSGAWYLGEFRKIGAYPESIGSVSGSQDRLSEFEGFSDSETHRQIPVNSGRISVLQRSARDLLEGSAGVSSFSGAFSPRGSAAHDVSAAASISELGLRKRSDSGSVERLLPGGSSVVVRRGAPSGRSVSGGSFTRPNVLVRRLRSGLGGFPVGGGRIRHLVGRGGSSLHQHARAVGGGEGSSRISPLRSSVGGGSLLRQHHSSLISSTSRGVSSSFAQFSGSENPPVGGGRGDHPSSSVCHGQEQRDSRLSFQAQSSDRVGVDAVSAGIQRSVQEMASGDRPFCNKVESPLFCLFCSDLGSHGCGGRRHVTVVGSFADICVPSDSLDQEGFEQAEIIHRHDDDIDSSVVASKGVVPRSFGSSGGASDPSSSQKGLTETTTFSQTSSQSFNASASCVETLQRSARAAGFSSRVARQLTRARRKSSIAVYQAKWSVFRGWCRKSGHRVSAPSISKIADFLLWLWKVRKLSVQSIRGYRSMLSSVFRFQLPSIGEDSVLRDLIRSFEIQRPRCPSVTPSWDLNIVLKDLMSEAYEPLGQKDLRTVTKKTLFLLSLATAKRVGEIQAISKSVVSKGEDLVVSYLPFFVAKTETIRNPLPRSFLVKSLKDFAGDLQEGSLLCPVRALKYYIEKTRSCRGVMGSLFVSPRCPTRPISKNAVSFFLREVIHGAGALRGVEGASVRAHSIRGVSTSVAFMRNWSISKVLEAATWKSTTVFSSFYFKDMVHEMEELKSLGPFVAAGAVIN